ncbi:DUF6779 domain-containing protein [Nocardia sp. NPDC088792]|uniref:DUF6779 domain-containing protein n=1 Tax=Nocardia sp. NPDC088792 TaxID=3364332 RepID=UPI0037FE00F2
MVSPARSSTSRRRREDAGKFFTGVLLLLGLIASVFLVFSDNVHMIRVGLVAALWAAALGALAVTRYRREAAVDKAKVGDLQKVYQLQLEREVAARREYELAVEARVRQEVGADATEMAALRAELTVLRENLQRLFDGELPFERPALRADAVRVQELPGRDPAINPPAANDNWDDAEPWDPWSSAADDDPRSRITPVFEPDHPAPPAFATPYDDPVTAETSVVTDSMRLDYERAEALKAQSGNAHGPQPGGAREPQPGSAREPQPGNGRAAESRTAPPTPAASAAEPLAAEPDSQPVTPAAAPTPEPASSVRTAKLTNLSDPLNPLNTDPLNTVPWFETDLAPAGNTPTDPTPRLTPPAAPSTPIGTASSRRRRRSDESTDDSAPRLSVAEIMANLRSETDR